MFWPIVIGVVVGLAVTHKMGILPNNNRPTIQAVSGVDERGHARRIKEGYLLSGMFNVSHVPAIAEQGIKGVLSLAPLEPVTIGRLGAQGITVENAFLGSSFRHRDKIRNFARRFDPSELLIHCEHGVDRTGNVAAHLLHEYHGYSIPEALYAVVNPSSTDVGPLNAILEDAGFRDSNRGPNSSGVGIYSLRPIGKSGGMKVRGAYGRMVTENISAMR